MASPRIPLSPARSAKRRSAVLVPMTTITGHEEGRPDGAAPGLVRALVDLPDDVATQGQSLFYLDAADALSKALNES